MDLVTRQGYLAHSQWFAELYGKPIEAKAGEIPEAEVEEAKKRGQTSDLSEVVDTLLGELRTDGSSD